jgi:hypothetical protein
MLGLPSEDELSIKKTIRFVDSILNIHPNISVGMAILNPFPGTPIWDTVRQYGFQLPETLDDWVNFFENWPLSNPIVKKNRIVLNISRVCNLAYGDTFASYIYLYKFPVPKYFGKPFIQTIGKIERLRWKKRMFNNLFELNILDKISQKNNPFY